MPLLNNRLAQNEVQNVQKGCKTRERDIWQFLKLHFQDLLERKSDKLQNAEIELYNERETKNELKKQLSNLETDINTEKSKRSSALREFNTERTRFVDEIGQQKEEMKKAKMEIHAAQEVIKQKESQIIDLDKQALKNISRTDDYIQATKALEAEKNQ